MYFGASITCLDTDYKRTGYWGVVLFRLSNPKVCFYSLPMPDSCMGLDLTNWLRLDVGP